LGNSARPDAYVKTCADTGTDNDDDADATTTSAPQIGGTGADRAGETAMVCSLVGADQVIWDENPDLGVIEAASMDQAGCEARCLATSGCTIFTVSAFRGYCELWSAASGRTVADLQTWKGYDTHMCAVTTSTTTATATTVTTRGRPTTPDRPELDLPQCTYFKDRAFLGQPDVDITAEMRNQAAIGDGIDVIRLELMGSNIPATGAITHDKCKVLCSLQEECRSFGYVASSGKCQLYSKAHTIATLGVTTGTDTYFCPERAGTMRAVDSCERWSDFNIQGSQGTKGWLGGNVDADIDSVGNNKRPYQLGECDTFCQEEPACKFMVYHQATSFCELWSAEKSMSDVEDAAGTSIDVYVCKTQLSCPAIAYEYTMPDSWDESAGCGEKRTRSEVETCMASGAGADGVACGCSNQRAVQTESEYWKCCTVDHTYTWGPWFPVNQDAPAVESTVLASSEQTCGLEMVRSEIKTCDATGRNSAGPCVCTDSSDWAAEKETKVNEPCVEDDRRTCDELGWKVNSNGVCYATNVLTLPPWQAVIQCNVLKTQTLNLEGALRHCESVGARLCTDAEVVAQPQASHAFSCRRDFNMRVWTSTPCGKNPKDGRVMMLKASNPKRKWCTLPTKPFENTQRCCADVILPSADFYIVPRKLKSKVSDDDVVGVDVSGEDDDDTANWVGSGLSSSSSGLSGANGSDPKETDQGSNFAETSDGDDDGSLGAVVLIAIVAIVICLVVGIVLAVRRHRNRRDAHTFEYTQASIKAALAHSPPVFVTTQV
jgi:hypothetical protein